jgi:hypothetical protein
MGTKWKLNPEDVGGGSSSGSGSRRGRYGRMYTVRCSYRRTMTHIPTGIEVTGEIPTGNYTKKQMRQLRQELEQKLFLELEAKVAKHLRIPGR